MRSVQSIIAERIIKKRGTKKRLSNIREFDHYLQQKQQENSQPYKMPEDVQQEFDFIKTSRFNMDCYSIGGSAPDSRKVLYLHGGGYFNQPLREHWKFIARMSRETGAEFIVPIYPKAPVHTYREAFDRVLPLYLEIRNSVRAEQMTVMGDSAGGGLSLGLAQLLLEKSGPQPGNIVLLSPWLDLSMELPLIRKLDRKDPMLSPAGMVDMGRYWAGGDDTEHYLLSPLHGPLKGLGRITVLVGTREILLADARALKTRADSQNVPLNYHEYKGMNHVFPVYPIPEADLAIRQLKELIIES